jgi:hypothetical protein
LEEDVVERVAGSEESEHMVVHNQLVVGTQEEGLVPRMWQERVQLHMEELVTKAALAAVK